MYRALPELCDGREPVGCWRCLFSSLNIVWWKLFISGGASWASDRSCWRSRLCYLWDLNWSFGFAKYLRYTPNFLSIPLVEGVVFFGILPAAALLMRSLCSLFHFESADVLTREPPHSLVLLIVSLKRLYSSLSLNSSSTSWILLRWVPMELAESLVTYFISFFSFTSIFPIAVFALLFLDFWS